MRYGETLYCEVVKEAYAVITFRNPPVNALDPESLANLENCLNDLANNKSLRAVIFTGEEKSFIAGADIKKFGDMPPAETSRYGQEKIESIEKCPLPVIAAINGYCFGGGFELALACDFRIASTKALFAFPEVGLGINPTYGGITRSPILFGEQYAKYLIYTAERITADEALKHGVLLSVTEPQDLMNAALELAEKIGRNGPIAIKTAKAAIHAARINGFREGLKEEALCSKALSATKDAKEALAAFVEKRQSVFHNE